MNPVELDKLLRDSFANYVVQTAMDFSDEETKARLIENIRPIIPTIRHTPYGRRIQGKIQEYDTRMGGGHVSPAGTMSAGQVSNGTFPRTGGVNAMGGYSSPNGAFGNGGNYTTSAGAPNGRRNGPAAASINNMMAQPHQTNGFNQGLTSLGHASRSAGVSNY